MHNDSGKERRKLKTILVYLEKEVGITDKDDQIQTICMFHNFYLVCLTAS
jgi:hypothetical protein